MTDEEGWPISTEVFSGNTKDTATVKNQIEKMAKRFGVDRITFVGDRGMIERMQISDLSDEDFNYITAITKPQIEKLIKDGVFQMSLFDNELVEISDNNIRYILRCNAVRANEVSAMRESKPDSLNKLVAQQNAYLAKDLFNNYQCF